MTTITEVTCACGQCALALEGRPFVTAECHCTSCRTAGERLGGLPLARPMQLTNGGTHFVLYRKDKVLFIRGQDLLREYRLKADAPTRRVVASCCNSPIFLEFQGAHWLSLYASLWPADTAPQPELRTMTSDLGPGKVLDDSLPAGRLPTARFYWKLLAAWIAMGFKNPAIAVNGEVRLTA